jgi:lipid A 3-O-deacylase
MTDSVGHGWLKGNIEGIVEGAFSYVFKNQNTYSAGVNLLARYNFLLSSKKWRPYVQGGFGILYTNLIKDQFGTSLDFASNAAGGIQYFFNQRNSINLELRYFHFSNAGIDSKNSGLDMINIFFGFSHIF